MTVTPHQAALDVLDRADALLALDAAPQTRRVREEIRRSCLAMGLAAIDTQMHWLIAKADLGGAIPKELSNLTVTFGDLVKADRAAVAARKSNKPHRPVAATRRVLMSAIAWRTFQRADKLSDGLRMVGIKLDDVAAAMVPAEKGAAVRQRLNKLADRRNAIVHEGDIELMQRPQTIKRATITGLFIQGELFWIRRFLTALDAVS